jgi:hypothetical protein
MKSGIIYNGPSQLDGAPIVVIATYSNRNRKTGAVLQTYVLRADVNPLEASKTGADYSICGACPMRGEDNYGPKAQDRQGAPLLCQPRPRRSNRLQGILARRVPDRGHGRGPQGIGRGRVVRVGTYGDPAACPDSVWTDLIADAQTWTAYTHQKPWRPDIAMQSADNYAEAKTHWASGPSDLPRDHRS